MNGKSKRNLTGKLLYICDNTAFEVFEKSLFKGSVSPCIWP